MAGGVTLPVTRCSLPPLLLLLPSLLLLVLPAAGRAAATDDDDTGCFRLGNVFTAHGRRHTDVRVNSSCDCEEVALYVKLNASGMPVDCTQNSSLWHDTKLTQPVADGLATFRTVVAGCFQARCSCSDGEHCIQGRLPHSPGWDFDGLDYPSYNLFISDQQMPGLPLRLDVIVRPINKTAQFYFPSLEVRLNHCPLEERAQAAGHSCPHLATGPIVANATANGEVRVVLGASETLTPGRYRVVVRPFGSWVCQGSNNGCRRVELNLTLSAAPDPAGAALPAAGNDRMKALYAVIGVTLAVIAAGLVFLWRECSAVRPGRSTPFAAKAPAPSGAQVLLVHLWADQRLAQLKSELRDAGLQVADFQERKLASLLRAMPVADVLVTDRLRHAKIVFLCSERALQLERSAAASCPGGGASEDAGGGFSTAAAGGPLGHEALFSAVLLCVRNSALAQDYQRVFVVLPEGGSDAGPAALVPGCRFRWPADAPELIRQLCVAPPETERVV